MTNSVIIASNAFFLADALRDMLRDADFKVFSAFNDNELAVKIKTVFPRYVFLEHCFHGCGTDIFIQKTVKLYRNIHIVVWTASDMKPPAAARFILAGAESFFSLRDTYQNILSILYRIAGGRCYCSADVEAIVNKKDALPDIGEELTNKEIEVVKMSCKGKSNKQIAEQMSVSEHTIRFHKASIYRKCGGCLPVDILRNCILRGIIKPEDLED